MDLFTLQMEQNLKYQAPLADRLRPQSLEEFVGQRHLVGKGKYLRRIIQSDRLSSMIFYGPPGVGKTTLAKIIAKTTHKNFIEISAVTSNLKELRQVLKQCEDSLKFDNIQTIVFIDEIHRFNKSQQDALLPFVERGILILIGATTENPYFEINKALLSRMQVLHLVSLTERDLEELIDFALQDKNRGLGKLPIDLTKAGKNFLVRSAQGDGRSVLNSLEIAALSTEEQQGRIHLSTEVLEDCIQQKNIQYDKDGNEHYDTISAFIKSVRGSDPDGALYYLAKMLEAGEDIKFIARRLIILASEDIGNADPMGMVMASACFQNIHVVGMPEARIILAQTTTYLATAKKSNASYLGIDEALKDLKQGIKGEIPPYLRDYHNPANDKSSEKYKYPHDFPQGYVQQEYLPREYRYKKYYRPKEIGYEKNIQDYLNQLKMNDEADL
ncbi:MAG: replication-associated recombination protein A [Tissierellia bacterium]|nr:replication-associated recombination protein A [Tissierellia bacterium]